MKNTHNLRFEFPKFQHEHNPPWMQNQIEPLGQKLDMPPQGLAHAPLDAVAFVSLAQHFACG
jgi:hypothetical protein